MQLNKTDYLDLIIAGLKEDVKTGDITSESIIEKDSVSRATLISKDHGVICGIDVFCDTMLQVDNTLEFTKYVKDGDQIKKGDVVLGIKGNTISILKAERTALNFIQRMSAIATKTNKYLTMIENTNTKILDTRKTLPGYRVLDKYSVFVGGGANHRMGLYDMFLIKENHIKAVSGLAKAVERARQYRNDINIEVETTNLDEVKEACESHVDIIMLDNMSNDLVGKAINIIKEYNSLHGLKIKAEVSGNITGERLISLAKMDVDFISMGELTHTVKAFDLSLLIL